MIDVKIRKEEIKIIGHADCAPKGKDVVCAAVSILAQNLIKSIQDLTEDKIEYWIDDGEIDIQYKDLSEKALLLVDSFFIGISWIAKTYPDYVQLS